MSTDTTSFQSSPTTTISPSSTATGTSTGELNAVETTIKGYISHGESWIKSHKTDSIIIISVLTLLFFILVICCAIRCRARSRQNKARGKAIDSMRLLSTRETEYSGVPTRSTQPAYIPYQPYTVSAEYDPFQPAHQV